MLGRSWRGSFVWRWGIGLLLGISGLCCRMRSFDFLDDAGADCVIDVFLFVTPITNVRERSLFGSVVHA